MGFPTLRLNINVTQPRIALETRPPSLRIEQELPRVEISIEYPTVHIDSSAPRAEIGLADIDSLARKLRDAARLRVLAAIAAWAEEGDRLREIEKGVTVGQRVAERQRASWPEINVAAVPRTRPEIEVSGGLWIEVRDGRLAIDLVPGYARVRALLHDVEVSAVDGVGRGSMLDVRV